MSFAFLSSVCKNLLEFKDIRKGKENWANLSIVGRIDSKVECRGRIHILKKTDLLGCVLMNALEPPFQAGYRVEVGWDSFSEYYSRELKFI